MKMKPKKARTLLRVLSLLSALSALSAFAGCAAPPPAPTHGPVYSVCCAGDSLTYGYGVGRPRTWCALASALTGHQFVNRGVNGALSDEIAALQNAVNDSWTVINKLERGDSFSGEVVLDTGIYVNSLIPKGGRSK